MAAVPSRVAGRVGILTTCDALEAARFRVAATVVAGFGRPTRKIGVLGRRCRILPDKYGVSPECLAEFRTAFDAARAPPSSQASRRK